MVRKAMQSDITSEIKQFGFSDEILRRTIERWATKFLAIFFAWLQKLFPPEFSQIYFQNSSTLYRVSIYFCRRLTSEDMFESMAEFVDAVQAVEQENNIKPPSGGASAACSNNLEQANMQLGVNIPHHLVNDQVEIKIQELRDANRCKICFDRESSCVFGSCGHLCSCVECSSKVKACPICRQKIVNIIRIYKAWLLSAKINLLFSIYTRIYSNVLAIPTYLANFNIFFTLLYILLYIVILHCTFLSYGLKYYAFWRYRQISNKTFLLVISSYLSYIF